MRDDYDEIKQPTTIPEFNPSNDARVTDIKRRTEELMAYVRGCGGNPRCTALALTKLEEASMWAVKSLFVL